MLPLRAADVQVYRFCDLLSEAIIYGMVVFSPWAFGTTEHWSIWTMSCAGYGLGVLLAAKLLIRWLKGYRPPRWDSRPAADEGPSPNQGRDPLRTCLENRFDGSSRRKEAQTSTVIDVDQSLLTSAATRIKQAPRAGVLVRALAGLTVLILLYCAVSALNARATYRPELLSFDYHDCVGWLPHSFDSRSTWFALWTYLGLACAFWAAQDWLLGKSSGEELAQWRPSTSPRGEAFAPIPARLRQLLWLLAINGALLGAESLVQRLVESPRLLFLVLPRIHQTADTQLGPYAYRSNGAQYFNLLWPVCVGFWWMLNRAHGHRRIAHHVLLLCAAIMVVCPMISTSRAGAAVTVLIASLAAFFLTAAHFLLAAHQQENRRARLITLPALAIFFAAALTVGFSLGWKTLKPRLAELNENLVLREELFDTGRRIAGDYPVFGTGPGTYESVSELYRPPQMPLNAFWPAQLHNDWLELRLTFGWVGSALVYAALGLVIVRWFARGGIHGGRRFVMLTWLALAGCLAHARYDFPVQVHSILFLFLLICAILMTLTRRPFRQS